MRTGSAKDILLTASLTIIAGGITFWALFARTAPTKADLKEVVAYVDKRIEQYPYPWLRDKQVVEGNIAKNANEISTNRSNQNELRKTVERFQLEQIRGMTEVSTKLDWLIKKDSMDSKKR